MCQCCYDQILSCAYTHYSVSNTCYSPNQMGSKAKHGAHGPAKANAKASIAKARAGGLAKAKAGGLAKAKYKAKEASSSRCTKGAGHQG